MTSFVGGTRDKLFVVGGIAAVVLLVLWWAKNRMVEGAAAVGAAVNPVNPQNIVNEAVNGIVRGVTGEPNQTLVGWFDDTFGLNQGLAPGESIDPVTGLILTPVLSGGEASV